MTDEINPEGEPVETGGQPQLEKEPVELEKFTRLYAQELVYYSFGGKAVQHGEPIYAGTDELTIYAGIQADFSGRSLEDLAIEAGENGIPILAEWYLDRSELGDDRCCQILSRAYEKRVENLEFLDDSLRRIPQSSPILRYFNTEHRIRHGEDFGEYTWEIFEEAIRYSKSQLKHYRKRADEETAKKSKE